MIEYLLQVLLAAIVLLGIGGLAQTLPFGVGSAKRYAQKNKADLFGNKPGSVTDVTDKPVTTDRFDELMTNNVSTLSTAKTFSWIVSKPISYYNPMAYFSREIVTQILVAAGLIILTHIVDFDTTKSLALTAISSVIAVIATYGQLANWWGLSARYSIGAGLILITSWLFASLLVTAIW